MRNLCSKNGFQPILRIQCGLSLNIRMNLQFKYKNNYIQRLAVIHFGSNFKLISNYPIGFGTSQPSSRNKNIGMTIGFM